MLGVDRTCGADHQNDANDPKGKSPLVTGGGDMELDSVSVAGHQVTITCFTLTDGKAGGAPARTYS